MSHGRHITGLSSSVVSHVLISGNLSVLRSRTVISYITGHHKIFYVLFHQIVKVYTDVCVYECALKTYILLASM